MRNKREDKTDIEGPRQLEFLSFLQIPGKRNDQASEEVPARRRSPRPKRVVHVDTAREKKLWPLAWSVMRIIRGLNKPATYVPRTDRKPQTFESVVQRTERESNHNSGIVSMEDKDALPGAHTMKPADAERMRQAFPARLRRNKRP